MTDFINSCESLASYLSQENYHLPKSLTTPSPPTPFSDEEAPFKRTKFYSMALNYFLDDSFHWALRLKECIEMPNWHWLRINVVEEDGFRTAEQDQYHCAISEQEAFAYIIQKLEHSATYPDDITIKNGITRFYFKSTVVAELAKMELFTTNSDKETRVENCLNKLSWFDSSIKVSEKLGKIPGFQDLITKEKPDRTSFRPLLFNPKSLLNQMATFLESVTKTKITRGKLLEITANFYGFKTWNHFTGTYTANSARRASPYLVLLSTLRQDGKPRFCLGEASALCAFTVAKSELSLSKYLMCPRLMSLYCTTQINYDDMTNTSAVMLKLPEASPNESALTKSHQILNCDDALQKLRDHFHLSLLPKEKVLKRPEQLNVSEQHLFVGLWLVFVEKVNNGYDHFIMERFNSDFSKREQRASSVLYKAAFRESPSSNEVWLKVDYDANDRDHKITGLNREQLIQIEKTFFKRGNWHLSTKQQFNIQPINI